ncbi:uncharacterized protein [Eurosta solidaginis]|uniref:uncharacterized protein n=1 Tax=Eurosta solidaginis TaxID=178769 RepID=UPI0035316C2B
MRKYKIPMQKKGISFFKLPKIPFIKQQWLKACEVREETLPKCPYVCSEHFAPTDISNSGNKIVLLKSAVPRNERQDCGEVFEQEEYLDEYIEFMEGQQHAMQQMGSHGKLSGNIIPLSAHKQDMMSQSYEPLILKVA